MAPSACRLPHGRPRLAFACGRPTTPGIIWPSRRHAKCGVPGAVSQRDLESLASRGVLQRGSLKKLWSSPGYSHCCFTARSELDTALYERIAGAFLSVDRDDLDGKAVLEAEVCTALVPGIEHGWEVVEAAEEEGLV